MRCAATRRVTDSVNTDTGPNVRAARPTISRRGLGIPHAIIVQPSRICISSNELVHFQSVDLRRPWHPLLLTVDKDRHVLTLSVSPCLFLNRRRFALWFRHSLIVLSKTWSLGKVTRTGALHLLASPSATGRKNLRRCARYCITAASAENVTIAFGRCRCPGAARNHFCRTLRRHKNPHRPVASSWRPLGSGTAATTGRGPAS